MAKVLKERAKETSEMVADITMQVALPAVIFRYLHCRPLSDMVGDITTQPCKEAVDRFEASFGLRLEEHRQASRKRVILVTYYLLLVTYYSLLVTCYLL